MRPVSFIFPPDGPRGAQSLWRAQGDGAGTPQGHSRSQERKLEGDVHYTGTERIVPRVAIILRVENRNKTQISYSYIGKPCKPLNIREKGEIKTPIL